MAGMTTLLVILGTIAVISMWHEKKRRDAIRREVSRDIVEHWRRNGDI